jgi:predicted TIM-barrel fold metal-dependent hydrolase
MTNDLVAATIANYPARFQGFATLPTAAPEDAALELERSVQHLGLTGAMLCSRTRDKNLDHPDFLPMMIKFVEITHQPPVARKQVFQTVAFQWSTPDHEARCHHKKYPVRPIEMPQTQSPHQPDVIHLPKIAADLVQLQQVFMNLTFHAVNRGAASAFHRRLSTQPGSGPCRWPVAQKYSGTQSFRGVFAVSRSTNNL